MGMLVTRPGAAAGLADLAGRRWAVADTRSLPTYLYFRAQMAEAGIEPGEVVTQPEETSALLALRNDEVDFTTAVFIPPVMPLDRQWVFGETDAEEWRVLGSPPPRSPIGYVLVAGTVVRLGWGRFALYFRIRNGLHCIRFRLRCELSDKTGSQSLLNRLK